MLKSIYTKHRNMAIPSFPIKYSLSFLLILAGCILGCKKNGGVPNSPPGVNVARYVVTTFAGNGNAGHVDGTGTAAEFNHPFGITIDGQNNLYVADEGNNCIRKITPAGVVSTLAGTGTAGYLDGPAASAMFNAPVGLVMDPYHNIYVVESNPCIRKISHDSVVSTFAGLPMQPGYLDGSGQSAQFAFLTGICLDLGWNWNNIHPFKYLYVSDAGNECIRRIDSAANVSTVAGSPMNAGFADGTGNAALFDNPQGIAVGLNNNIWVADVNNNRIRHISGANGSVTTWVGSSQEGYADGKGAAAKFAGPTGITLQVFGFSDSAYLYVTDAVGESIRFIDGTGNVSIIAGDPLLPGFVDSIGTAAKFASPMGITTSGVLGPGLILYVADYINNRIRKIVKQ
jgi:hypothetical protein